MPSERLSTRFFDGESAVAKPVGVETGPASLIVRDAAGRHLAVWPWPKVRVVARSPELRLAFGNAAPRLVIADPALAAAVRARLPAAWRPRARLAAALAAAALGVVAAGYGVLWLLPPVAGPLIPDAWAATLGRTVLRGLAGDRPFCAGPGLADLERLGQGLAAAAEAPDGPPLHLHVIAMRAPNAFALPGGIVVVTSGLIERAPGPDAVAGVLAHELGHVTLNHPEQAVVGMLGAQALGLVLSVGAGDAGTALDAGLLLAVLRHSREQEQAADAIGLRLLRARGIGGAGLATLLRRLDDQDGGGPMLLSTHPGTAERAEAASTLPAGRGPAMPADAWQRLREVCRATGEAPPAALGQDGPTASVPAISVSRPQTTSSSRASW